jgi:hypothetical protein
MSTLTVNPINDASDAQDNYFGGGSWKPPFGSTNDTTLKVMTAKTSAGTDYEMVRSYMIFTTSALPDNATISAAKIRLYVSAANDGLGSGAIHAVISTGSNSYTLTDLGSIANASISTSAYNEINLNATGIAQISKTGNTTLGLAEYHDQANVTPPSQADTTYTFNDYADANKPELVITYTLPNAFFAIL